MHEGTTGILQAFNMKLAVSFNCSDESDFLFFVEGPSLYMSFECHQGPESYILCPNIMIINFIGFMLDGDDFFAQENC